MTERPKASIILVASGGVRSIARIMQRIRAQTIAPNLEVVISGRSECVAELGEIPKEELADIRVVTGDFSTSARARTSAIKEARGPFVIFAEDHAFPRGDDWAERLISHLSASYSGAGPVMRNDNPETGLSWANLIVEYGEWLDAESPKSVNAIPGHNSAYRRDALLDYGDALGDMLEAEWVMHADMRDRGMALLLDPNVEVEHVNFSRLDRTLKLQFFAGWMFAASRAADWGIARRILYALSFPAIPLVRLVRCIIRCRRSTYAKRELGRAMPFMALLLCASAAGEALGYAFGDCGRRRNLSRLEYERWRNVLPGELSRLAETP